MIDLIDRFISFKRHNRGRAVRTGELYRQALLRLVEFLKGKPLADVSEDDLTAFTGPWLAKQYQLQPQSRRLHVAAVRGFWQWLMMAGVAVRNPASALPYPSRGRPLPVALSLATLEQLMFAPDFESLVGIRDAAVMAVLAHGPRASEVVGLNVSDVVTQVVDGKPRLALRLSGKGDKQRIVPLGQQADLMLRLYMEHAELKGIDRSTKNGDEVLFVTTGNHRVPAHDYVGEHRRMSRHLLRKRLMYYGRQCGLPVGELHPHAFRHLFGTELAESEVDLLTRQNLMGHEDPKSTGIYTRMAARRLTQVVDKANPLAKVRTPVSELLDRLKSKPGAGV